MCIFVYVYIRIHIHIHTHTQVSIPGCPGTPDLCSWRGRTLSGGGGSRRAAEPISTHSSIPGFS